MHVFYFCIFISSVSRRQIWWFFPLMWVVQAVFSKWHMCCICSVITATVVCYTEKSLCWLFSEMHYIKDVIVCQPQSRRPGSVIIVVDCHHKSNDIISMRIGIIHLGISVSLIFRLHHSTAYVDAAYCYRCSSVVWWLVGLSQSWAVQLQKLLSRSRCRLGCGLWWAQGTMCYILYDALYLRAPKS